MDAKRADECTPLYIASQNGHEATVKTLLAAKAQVDAKAASGHTALDIARQRGHTRIVAVLEAWPAEKAAAERAARWRMVSRVIGTLMLAWRRAAERAYAPGGAGFDACHQEFAALAGRDP